MVRISKPVFGKLFLMFLAALLVGQGGCLSKEYASDVHSMEAAGAEEASLVATPPRELIYFQNYASLTELITVICDEAARQFNGFFGSRVVMVKPFVVVTEFGGKGNTALGAALADQMIAMINNNAVNEGLSGTYPQEFRGTLQEVDGYLRIHMSGVNSKARRRSYTVNVEMSEALYRALHGSVNARL